MSLYAKQVKIVLKVVNFFTMKKWKMLSGPWFAEKNYLIIKIKI